MKTYMNRVKHSWLTLIALWLAFTGLLPVFVVGAASANQVSSRSIKLSSSSPAGSAATTTYTVSFTTATTNTIQGVVVDFCDSSPIIGDSAACTTPAGFTVGAGSVANVSASLTTAGSWTAGSLNSGRSWYITNASNGSISTGTAVSFDITNVQNPTTANHTYYARILTYATTTGATSYVSTAPGAHIDDGGIALATGTTFTITAKVMESLSFCVYASSCGDVPDFTIGHGTPAVLTSGQVDSGTVTFSISTNAKNTTSINLRGDTLKAGTNSIPAVNGGSSTTPAAIVAGTAAFGMYVLTAGSLSVNAPYSTAGSYGLDTSGSGVTSTYGDPIGTFTGAVANSVTTLKFAATASAATPAGVYTAAEQLIAFPSY